MDTISTATATVIGSRHLRTARNGQDAVASWQDLTAAPGIGVVVVSDGCGSGASSEVGARLGSTAFARLVGERLANGARVDSEDTWLGARLELVQLLATLADHVGGSHADRVAGPRADLMNEAREQILHDLFLFTIVAAAFTPDGGAVWALGDGAYSFGDTTRELGPFADNQPPYIAYDLLREPERAHFEIAPPSCDTIVIATDGASELIDQGGVSGAGVGVGGAGVGAAGLARFTGRRYLEHPDALRRELALLARSHERVDWDARRVVRTPAVLQDDCAVAVLRRRRPS